MLTKNIPKNKDRKLFKKELVTGHYKNRFDLESAILKFHFRTNGIFTQKEIGQMTGVSQGLVSVIINGGGAYIRPKHNGK